MDVFTMWFIAGMLVFVFKSKKWGLVMIFTTPFFANAGMLLMALAIAAILIAWTKFVVFLPAKVIRGYWRSGYDKS